MFRWGKFKYLIYPINNIFLYKPIKKIIHFSDIFKIWLTNGIFSIIIVIALGSIAQLDRAYAF